MVLSKYPNHPDTRHHRRETVLPLEDPLINLKRYGSAAAVVLTAGLCVSAGIGSAASGDGWSGNAPSTLTTVPTGTNMSTPGKNKSFLCSHRVSLPGGIPADVFFPPFVNPGQTWATGDTLSIAAMPTVPGSMRMKSVFKETDTATTRRFKGNGIPNTPMGTFPIVPGSPAYDIYSQLPAQGYATAADIPVMPYNLDVTVPRKPKMNKKPTCIDWLTTGIITQTGAAWHAEVAFTFSMQAVDPNAALPTDLCFGHPYQGMYHNHGYSWKCFPNKGKAGVQSPLYGYALDGFGVYGPLGANGKPIKNSQLDECHGMTSKVMWEGKMTNMYHYVTNNEYPYSIGCFRGTPGELPKAMSM